MAPTSLMREPDFALEGLWISRYFVRKELQRNKSVKTGVFSFVDHTHPTPADLFNNAVVRDDLADHSMEAREGRLILRTPHREVNDPSSFPSPSRLG